MSDFEYKTRCYFRDLVPGIGIELMTFALQVRCSTN